MSPQLFWIPVETPGRLAISSRPRGGDWLSDEVTVWKKAGVNRVVSLLDALETNELQLQAEAAECESQGLEFQNVPVADRGTPQNRQRFSEAVLSVVDALMNAQSVAVHCRQGIGRSGLFVVAVLNALGWSTDEAIRVASQSRGRAIPETVEQTEWLRRHARTGLATPGAL